MRGIPEVIRSDLRRAGVASVLSRGAVEVFAIYEQQKGRDTVLDYIDDVDENDDAMSVDEPESNADHRGDGDVDDAMDL